MSGSSRPSPGRRPAGEHEVEGVAFRDEAGDEEEVAAPPPSPPAAGPGSAGAS